MLSKSVSTYLITEENTDTDIAINHFTEPNTYSQGSPPSDDVFHPYGLIHRLNSMIYKGVQMQLLSCNLYKSINMQALNIKIYIQCEVHCKLFGNPCVDNNMVLCS